MALSERHGKTIAAGGLFRSSKSAKRAPSACALGVESLEVIQGEVKARDGSEKVERVMRTMPVVVVKEKRQTVGALSGRGIGMSISPFAERGLNEALGFAVGFWSVETSEAVFEAEARDLRGESGGAIGRAVIGVEAVDTDAEF